jgi:hypothetical protein
MALLKLAPFFWISPSRARRNIQRKIEYRILEVYYHFSSNFCCKDIHHIFTLNRNSPWQYDSGNVIELGFCDGYLTQFDPCSGSIPGL